MTIDSRSKKKGKIKKKEKDNKKVEKKNCGNHFPLHFQVSNFITILIIQPSILAFTSFVMQL